MCEVLKAAHLGHLFSASSFVLRGRSRKGNSPGESVRELQRENFYCVFVDCVEVVVSQPVRERRG